MPPAERDHQIHIIATIPLNLKLQTIHGIHLKATKSAGNINFEQNPVTREANYVLCNMIYILGNRNTKAELSNLLLSMCKLTEWPGRYERSNITCLLPLSLGRVIRGEQ